MYLDSFPLHVSSEARKDKDFFYFFLFFYTVVATLMGFGEAGVHAVVPLLARPGSLCMSKVEICYSDAKSVA